MFFICAGARSSASMDRRRFSVSSTIDAMTSGAPPQSKPEREGSRSQEPPGQLWPNWGICRLRPGLPQPNSPRPPRHAAAAARRPRSHKLATTMAELVDQVDANPEAAAPSASKKKRNKKKAAAKAPAPDAQAAGDGEQGSSRAGSRED